MVHLQTAAIALKALPSNDANASFWPSMHTSALAVVISETAARPSHLPPKNYSPNPLSKDVYPVRTQVLISVASRVCTNFSG